MKRAIVILSALLISSAAIAQLAVTNAAPYNTSTYLVNNVLLGNGVTASNIQFSGNANQLGYFSNGLAGAVNPLGLDSGIVFSSGDVNGIPPGGGGLSTVYGGPGDPDLLTIAQTVNAGISSTQDAATLEFDFIPVGDTVEFRFVFASEEYLTYVNSVFNDIFSFFISGPGFTGPYAAPAGFPNGSQNLAVVPGTLTPITISTIQPGLNAQYYINNPGSNTHDFNGYTTVMSIKFHVTCNALFHFKFSIADCQDGSLDTGVFMEGSSFSSTPPTTIQFSTATIGGDSTIIEGCDAAVLNLTRSDTAGNATLHYAIGGTATNGVDYALIADSVTYLAGIDTASITIIPFTDAILEGQESIKITSTSINACGVTIVSSDSLYIADVPILTTTAFADTVLNCPTQDSIPIWVGVSGSPDPTTFSYTWSNSQGNVFPTDSVILVPALQSDTFYVDVTSYCNLITVKDTIVVTVLPLYTLSSTQSDSAICIGDAVDFTTTPSSGGTYTYNWTSSAGNILGTPTDSITSGTFNIVGSDMIIVEVDKGIGCIVKDTMYISVAAYPFIVSTSPDTAICIGGPANLYATANGTNAPFSFIWNNGTIPGNGPHIVNPTANTTIYSVYVQDANGCESASQNIIVTLRDSITINNIELEDTTICSGTETTIIVDATGGGTGLIYTWINSSGVIIGITDTNQFTITPSYDGEIFSVIVSDSCTTPAKTDSITTDWANIVLPTYTASSIAGCYKDINFIPTFTNTTVTASTITNVNWNFGDGSSFDFPFTNTPVPHSYANAGFYDVTLTLTDDIGCKWDTIMPQFQVNAYPYPYADFGWNPNPTDYLNAQITFDNQSTGNVFNQWFFITDTQYSSNDVDPVFQFPQDRPGNYDVTLITTTIYGCKDSVSKIVVIDDVFLFYIPTAFTPDGDGLNDQFKVVGEGLDLSSFRMTVFNKWGQLIFESNNPDNGWDGKQSGSLVPDGTYIWKIDVKEANSSIVHNKDGFITIVR